MKNTNKKNQEVDANLIIEIDSNKTELICIDNKVDNVVDEAISAVIKNDVNADISDNIEGDSIAVDADIKNLDSTESELDTDKKPEKTGGIFNIYKNVKITKRALDIVIVACLVALVVVILVGAL